MPVKAREYANSKIYHVMIKGINDQKIFFDDQDRMVYLKYLKSSQDKYKYDIYSYCLMSNHVHLVLKAEKEFLSRSMQSQLIKYVNYFNQKYERKGHLVQDRFKSKIVESQEYFLEVCRYVHRNPEKAGISKTNKYKWSSYQAYAKGIDVYKLVDTSVLLDYFENDIKKFIKFTTKEDNVHTNLENYAEYEILNRISDVQLKRIILELFDIKEEKLISDFFRTLTKLQLHYAIKKISKIKNVNKTQVARVIHISRKEIEKNW